MSYKIKNNEVIVVENLEFDAVKTKSFVAFNESLKVADKKSVLVLGEANKNVYLSARNIQNSKVITVSELSTYDILNNKCLLLTEGSIESISKTLTA